MRKFIPFAQPLFGKEEKSEVAKALDSGWVTLGPRTKQFEEEFAIYTGAKYAIALTSCTAALHLSLIALGIKKGDEVITSSFTFVCAANVIVNVGATPVFADIDNKTWNLDPKEIEKKITQRTKAIIVVHYGGHPADMDEIEGIAKKHKIPVIEDCAHAIGALYKGKKIGTSNNINCFSFHAIKNMSTGDGGMITVNDEKLAQTFGTLRLHGMSKDAWKRHSSAGSWKYDIILPGLKYNMSDIAAAIGIHQLHKLDKFNAIRKAYTKLYNNGFKKIAEITIPFVSKDIVHAHNLYSVIIDWSKLNITRDQMIEELKKYQIGANAYFMASHLFSFYKENYGHTEGELPVTEFVSNNLISLPLYPKMKKSDVLYIIKIVKELITSSQKKTTHGKN